MGAVSFVSNSTVQTLTTSASVSYPASLAAGNLLVLHCASVDSTISSGTPSGWTELSGSPFSGGGVNQARIYYKISTGSETGSISLTTSAGTKGHARIEQYAPAATETLAVLSSQGVTDTNANTSLSIASGTFSAATNDLVVAIGFSAGDFTAGAYSGFNLTATGFTVGSLGTRGSGRAGTTSYQWCALDKPIASGTSGTATATGTGNATGVTGIIAYLIVRSQASSLTPGYPVKAKVSGSFVSGVLRVRASGTWITPTNISAYHPGTPTTPTEVRTNLPWNLQTSYTQGVGKWAMSHYVPWYPISLNDANPKALGGSGDTYDLSFLPPGAAAYQSFGGYFRDRPIPRAPRGSSFRDLDMYDEIKRVSDAKFDGFFIDYVSSPTTSTENFNNINRLFNASDAYYAATGKRVWIMPMPDGGGSATNSVKTSSTVVNVNASADALADTYGTWMSEAALWRYDSSGYLTIPVFNPEKWASGNTNTVADRVTYWNRVKSRMLSVYGVNVRWLFCWVSDWNSTSTGAASTLGGLATVLSRWGDRDDVATKAANNNNRNAPAYSHSQYSKDWFHYVAPGDNRPNDTNQTAGYRWWESRGSRTLENSWMAAIDAGSNCQGIQQTTWNDFAEAAQLCPSVNQGYSLVDLNTYWLHKFKTGAFPTIERNGLYLYHRIHATSKSTSSYTGPQTRFGLAWGSTTAVNEVEVLCFAKVAGTVELLVNGSVTQTGAVTVGMNRLNWTLPSSGVISARMKDAGGSVIAGTTATSNVTMGAALVSDDFQYRCFSSLRQFTGT